MKPTADSRTHHVEGLLRQAAQAQRPSGRRYRAIQYLNSFDAKLNAVREAHSKMRPHRRPAKAKLESIAGGLDAWKGTDELVTHKR
jgi:hypothetical protein